MKLLTLLITLWAMSVAPLLRADGAANAKRLAELRALSFSEVKKISIARLSVPAKKEEGVFHGCALRTEWKEIPTVTNKSLVGGLRALISDDIAVYSKAGDAALILLEPFGFVYGEFGVRLETDRGLREFSVSFEKNTGYVYAYDGKKHNLYFAVEGVSEEKLKQSMPNQILEPTPSGVAHR